jgi:8-oxo-dGTP pyrophosphatase MutT (NUDIX family)
VRALLRHGYAPGLDPALKPRAPPRRGPPSAAPCSAYGEEDPIIPLADVDAPPRLAASGQPFEIRSTPAPGSVHERHAAGDGRPDAAADAAAARRLSPRAARVACVGDDWVTCPRCSGPLARGVRGGVERPTCPACGFDFFANPGVGAACVIRDRDGRVLLVQRGPDQFGAGRWCFPCGYVEWGEDVRAAAAREALEEAGVAVTLHVVHVASNSTTREAERRRVVSRRRRPTRAPPRGRRRRGRRRMADPAAPPPPRPTDLDLLRRSPVRGVAR